MRETSESEEGLVTRTKRWVSLDETRSNKWQCVQVLSLSRVRTRLGWCLRT